MKNRFSKFGIVLIAASVSFAAVAEQSSVIATRGGKPMDAETMKRSIYRHTGGKLINPSSFRGNIAIVNCQKAVPSAWLMANADFLKTLCLVKIDILEGAFEWPAPKVQGNASLYIVDDAKMPSLLAAPESRWALVNVAPLKAGAGQQEAFLKARLQKEMTRGFALLAGAQDSSYPKALVGCITDSKQLDDHLSSRLPVDVVGRFEKYLSGYGIGPGKITTYRKACFEGWAPAPTNDVQKAIWDRVHELPTKPIKIQPETKPVKD